MNLNLGCGDVPIDGAVNVDVRCGDVCADIRALPFPTGTFDHIRAFDVLEHFVPDDLPGVFAEIGRVATGGATLHARVPNLRRLACDLDDPDIARVVIRNIYGGHRWGPAGSWDCHHWGWTVATLRADLADAGWHLISADEHPRNMVVEATR